MKTKDTQHLGDGVYVGHDGHQLWIGANHHENMTVAIDESVFHSLVAYASKLGWSTKL